MSAKRGVCDWSAVGVGRDGEGICKMRHKERVEGRGGGVQALKWGCREEADVRPKGGGREARGDAQGGCKGR